MMRNLSAIGVLLVACSGAPTPPRARVRVVTRRSAVVERACAHAAADNRTALAVLRRSEHEQEQEDCDGDEEECAEQTEDEPESFFAAEGRLLEAIQHGCLPAGRGAWSPRLAPPAAPTELVLYFVDERGGAHRGPVLMDDDELSAASGYYGAQIGTLFDWDGDGVAEIVVESESCGEGCNSTLEISTFREGAVRAYAGLPEDELRSWDAEFQLVQDFDDDGRPDLFGWRPYTLRGEHGDCNACGSAYSTPTVPYHSRRDGTFASDDAAVVHYFEEHCPARDAPLVVASSSHVQNETVNAVLCARMRGASEAAVRRRIRAEWPRSTAPSELCEWDFMYQLLDFASVTPHLRLPGAAPSWSAEPEPASSSRRWHCLCYSEERDDEEVRSMLCRPSAAECARAATTHTVTTPCTEVQADHPGDIVGIREPWQPSERGGLLWAGACLFEVM